MYQHLSGVLDAYPGWLAVACAGIAVISYFLGCFNGAVVVSRYILRNDVRNHGSGNAGLTNFYRTFGGPLTLVVILSDVLKAVIAELFAIWLFGTLSPLLIPFGKYWAGLFCLLGHMYPCTFQFRGGKGILSGGAMAIVIDWRVALVVWGGFLILAILTKYVSLGSCSTGVTFPIVTWCVYRDPILLVIAIIIGGLILWKHRGNIQRLIAGNESKFALRKKGDPVPAAAPEAVVSAVTEAERELEKRAAKKSGKAAKKTEKAEAEPENTEAPADAGEAADAPEEPESAEEPAEQPETTESDSDPEETEQ